MKKIVSLFLVAVTALSLCGCGSENAMETGNSASASSVISSVSDVSSAEAISEPQSEPEPETFKITLSFLGDMILGSQLETVYKDSFSLYAKNKPADYFLDKVRHILQKDDFTIANLEVVLSDQKLTPIKKGYSPAFWFKAPTKNIEILSGSSVEGVLLNNNHTGDYGEQGFNDTVKTVENAGIKYGSNTTVMYFQKNGFKIAVLCVPLWAPSNGKEALVRLKKVVKKSDYQVVLFHGGTEKIHKPEQFKVDAAHSFIDNGADLVVGGHPHVLQPREIYKGKEIIYSIGNFCYGGSRYPENRTVIYQQTITVDTKTLKAESEKSNIIPCYVYTGNINNYQPAVIKNKAYKKQVIDFMNGKADSPI